MKTKFFALLVVLMFTANAQMWAQQSSLGLMARYDNVMPGMWEPMGGVSYMFSADWGRIEAGLFTNAKCGSVAEADYQYMFHPTDWLGLYVGVGLSLQQHCEYSYREEGGWLFTSSLMGVAGIEFGYDSPVSFFADVRPMSTRSYLCTWAYPPADILGYLLSANVGVRFNF